MRIALIDDDPQDRDWLHADVRAWLADRHLVGEVCDYASRNDFLSAWQPRAYSLMLFDCILDENDPSAPTGIDLARQVRGAGDSTPIVFITSSRDFAIDGYSVHAAGYLVKPFTREDLARVLDDISLPSALVRVGTTQTNIPVADVVWCRAHGHSVDVHARHGSRELRTSLRELRDTLASHGNFLSPARGYLANLAHVKGMEGADFVMADGARVPISRDAVAAMRAAWTDYLFEQARSGGDGHGTRI